MKPGPTASIAYLYVASAEMFSGGKDKLLPAPQWRISRLQQMMVQMFHHTADVDNSSTMQQKQHR
jgi:hypothetical protein